MFRNSGVGPTLGFRTVGGFGYRFGHCDIAFFSGHISERLNQEIGPHNLRWIVVEECEIIRGTHRNRLATPWTPFCQATLQLRFSVARSGTALHRCMLSHSRAKWDMKLALPEPVYHSPFYLPYFVLFPLRRANLAPLSPPLVRP